MKNCELIILLLDLSFWYCFCTWRRCAGERLWVLNMIPTGPNIADRASRKHQKEKLSDPDFDSREIREEGIYKLPDGNDYAARSAGHGRYFLYLCKDGVSNPPRYLITRAGRIQPWVVDEWVVEDLVDTGETFDFTEEFKCPDPAVR